MTAYENACVSLEMQIPDLLPNTQRVRAPMNISEVGAEFSGGAFLPAASFAMMETPPSNAEYFRNAFEMVQARRGMTMADYHDFDEFEKVRTMGLVISYAVQSFDYIGDAVEMGRRTDQFFKRRHVGTEEFGHIWSTLTGDCEDSAIGIYSTLKAFIANSDFDFTKDKHLLEMQAIARDDYVPLSTLAVVHGAKVGDQTENFGAHMFLSMMPRHYFEAGLQKTYDGRVFQSRLEPAVAPVGANAAVEISKETRPFFFCEGTGIIDPIGFKDPLFEQYKYIGMNMRSAVPFKKRIPHDAYAPSPFYFANLFAISGKFIEEGVNVGGFVFGQQAANAHGMVRGSLYTDLLSCKDNLALLPQPEIPAATMRLIEEANAFVVPPRPLVLDRSKPLAGKEKHPLWDKFVSSINSFGRKRGNKAQGSVDLIIRPHQFDENVVNQMIAEAAQLERIWAASYQVEHITNSIYNYRVQLYVH